MHTHNHTHPHTHTYSHAHVSQEWSSGEYWGANGAGWCATSSNYDEDPDEGYRDCTCECVPDTDPNQVCPDKAAIAAAEKAAADAAAAAAIAAEEKKKKPKKKGGRQPVEEVTHCPIASFVVRILSYLWLRKFELCLL